MAGVPTLVQLVVAQTIHSLPFTEQFNKIGKRLKGRYLQIFEKTQLADGIIIWQLASSPLVGHSTRQYLAPRRLPAAVDGIMVCQLASGSLVRQTELGNPSKLGSPEVE